VKKKGIYIIGHARHGKDTVADHLRKLLNYKIESSSHIAMNEFIYPVLKDKYGYNTPEECYEDRVNHRAEWFNMIVDYNTPDLTALTRLIFSENDAYVGIRNKNELAASIDAGIVSHVIWVDACQRLPEEPTDSMTVGRGDATYILDNNKGESELLVNILMMIQELNLKAKL
jgi:hypothetical protein